MKYFVLEPEVAGGLGPGCVIDHEVHPPVVRRLQYTFDGWLGDDLLESTPCFIVTCRLRQGLAKANLSGIEFDKVETVMSDTFVQLYPGRILPEFSWLKVTGMAGRDDFGIGPDQRLVVSERALAALRTCSLQHCEVIQI